MTRATTIFISHTQDDRAFAEELSNALRAKGFDATGAWDVAVGSSIEEQLQHALGAANTYVVLLSERTLLSPWVAFELGAAIGGRKRLMLVYLSQRAVIQTPEVLRRTTSIDAKTLRPAEVADRIADAVGA